MITLQDISKQLLKPAKDLADWKFPLSQVYYTIKVIIIQYKYKNIVLF